MTKPASIYIIQNPVAGTSDPQQVQETLSRILSTRDIPYQLYQTKADDNINELARKAAETGYDWVWAVGGDGTVSAVANGLIGTNTLLGIIPTGSGNSLARELGMPLNTERACQVLLDNSRSRRIDTIRVENSYYLLTVSAGVGAKTMAETKRSQKRILGRLAYMINGLRLLLARAIWPFRVEIDGTYHRIRATEIIAANAGIIGYRMLRWGQGIRVDDGQLNLCYVRVSSVQALLRALRGAALEQQNQVLELNCLAAREEIVISCASRLPVQGDGEPIGTTPVRIKVVPGAVSVLTPADQD